MSWNLQSFAAFPLTVPCTPSDIGLWLTDSAVSQLALTLDDAPLIGEVPLCGVWIGLESPLNVCGNTVHAMHLQSLDGMAYKTALVIAMKQGIPQHRVSVHPPRRIRDAILAEGVTYLAAYTVPGVQSAFSTEVVRETWQPIVGSTEAPETQDMIRIAEAHGARMSPNPAGDVGILTSLVRAALSAHTVPGSHGITASSQRVSVTHPDADHADIIVMSAA